MNFHQGDYVVHQNFGVGIVVSIEGMNLSGNGPRLFYRVDFLKTTVWVPVGHQPAGGLRPITPKDHLAKYRALLQSPPDALDRDFRKRHSMLEERMDSGTFQGLCEIIRDLYVLVAQKRLNQYEKTLYKQTREALVSEWATSSGLTPAEAMRDIDGCLHSGGQSSDNA